MNLSLIAVMQVGEVPQSPLAASLVVLHLTGSPRSGRAEWKMVQ